MKNILPKSLERVFLSRWFLLILLAITCLIAIGYARAYYEDYTVRAEITRLQTEVKNLEKKKFATLELLQYVNSDDWLDAKARIELNLKKPGENVLVIPELKSAEPQNKAIIPVQSVTEITPLNNPVKWWYYFTRHSLPN